MYCARWVVVTDEPGSGDPKDPANEGDKITVTIKSEGDVLENAAPKFTVKVDQVLKQDLTVTLSNGDKIKISASGYKRLREKLGL